MISSLLSLRSLNLAFTRVRFPHPYLAKKSINRNWWERAFKTGFSYTFRILWKLIVLNTINFLIRKTFSFFNVPILSSRRIDADRCFITFPSKFNSDLLSKISFILIALGTTIRLFEFHPTPYGHNVIHCTECFVFRHLIV